MLIVFHPFVLHIKGSNCVNEGRAEPSIAIQPMRSNNVIEKLPITKENHFIFGYNCSFGVSFFFPKSACKM